MHPEFVRQIAADRLADLTRQAVESHRARAARKLLRNPPRRIAGRPAPRTASASSPSAAPAD